MPVIINTIFAFELALLFTHEMDAIRKQEWKMFIFLKDMADEKAYHIFMLLHIPLYAVIVSLLLSPFLHIEYYITDVFLVLHTLLHLGFRKHPTNKFNNNISNGIIFSAGLFAVFHLLLVSRNLL